MRNTLMALCLAATTALSPIAASAEKLTFGTGNVIIHPINQRIFMPWAEEVNAQAGDTFEVAVRHGPMLVNAQNYVDRITDDIVQIAWGMLAFKPGLFPRSMIAGVPFISGSAEANAMAFCALHEAGALDEELGDFVPLFFVPFPQSSAHLNGGPLTTLSDLEGKKIMVGSPTASTIVSHFGGTPLSIVVPEQYQALSRSTADGNFMTFTAFPAFNLDEVTTDHLKLPLGGAMGMVFMTRGRYDGLSDEARAVIDANRGCDVSREMGKRVDQWEADGKAYVAAQDNHTLNDIDPAEFEALRDELGPVINANFAERVPGGAELLEMWAAEMEIARAATGE